MGSTCSQDTVKGKQIIQREKTCGRDWERGLDDETDVGVGAGWLVSLPSQVFVCQIQDMLLMFLGCTS